MPPYAREVLLTPLSKSFLLAEKETREKTQAQQFVLHPIWETYSNPLLVKQTTNGDARLKALLQKMSELDVFWRRSKHQIDFHRYFISSLLTKIYGEKDIHAHYSRLCNEFEVEDLNPNSVIIAPRRFGKTTAVAFFCACWLVTQPNAKIVVYSTGKRLSTALLEKTKGMIQLITNAPISSNQEVLTVETEFGKSRLSSYPSNENIGNGKRQKIILFFATNSSRFLFSFSHTQKQGEKKRGEETSDADAFFFNFVYLLHLTLSLLSFRDLDSGCSDDG